MTCQIEKGSYVRGTTTSTKELQVDATDKTNSPAWVCDFCNDPRPVWTCPTADVLMMEIDVEGRPLDRHVSVGGWAACDECCRLVRNGDRNRLAKRALRAIGVDDAFAVLHVRAAHGSYWSARTGDPVLIKGSNLEMRKRRRACQEGPIYGE